MRRLALALALGALAPAAAAEEVVVFAAASLKTALDAVAADWQAQSGDTVTVAYAGSPALARQIAEGAPADIFLSASPEWMDAVDAAGLLVPGTRRDLLTNSLVLVAQGRDAPSLDPGQPGALAARLGPDGRLAMAFVDSVPAGQYGKAALTTLGLWAELEPRLVQSENVRAALMLVATGEAPLGVVYATDAGAADNVTVVATFPADSHPPIRYPVARLGGAGGEGAGFLAYLTGPEAGARFAAQGFGLLP